MRFAPVPSESKTSIRKAGETLARGLSNQRNSDDIILSPGAQIPEYFRALDLAGRWRAAHAYPINTFQATLRERVRTYRNDPIVAQRLKRMNTIIDKLERYPSMNLLTMQDIAGLRAIVGDMDDVSKLASSYSLSTRFEHILEPIPKPD